MPEGASHSEDHSGSEVLLGTRGQFIAKEKRGRLALDPQGRGLQ